MKKRLTNTSCHLPSKFNHIKHLTVHFRDQSKNNFNKNVRIIRVKKIYFRDKHENIKRIKSYLKAHITNRSDVNPHQRKRDERKMSP